MFRFFSPKEPRFKQNTSHSCIIEAHPLIMNSVVGEKKETKLVQIGQYS